MDAEDIIYLDETGIDDNEIYEYAWGPKGERIHVPKQSYKKRRISIISSLNGKTLQAPFVFEGYCDKEVFQTYIDEVLVPSLKPKQVVIMDNASFHKAKSVQASIEKAGCRLLYLPAYSPDLNPIEHCWHSLKTAFRKYLSQTGNDLYAAATFAFTTVTT